MKEKWGGRSIALQHNKITCREQRLNKKKNYKYSLHENINLLIMKFKLPRT